MVCKICGTNNGETAAFCENCGNPLHRPDPVPQPQPIIAEPIVAPVPTGELPAKGLGIAGMILGIVSILFGCCTPVFPFLCAAVGLILSCIAMGKAKSVSRKNHFGTAGLILGIIGTIVSLTGLILSIFGLKGCKK